MIPTLALLLALTAANGTEPVVPTSEPGAFYAATKTIKPKTSECTLERWCWYDDTKTGLSFGCIKVTVCKG